MNPEKHFFSKQEFCTCSEPDIIEKYEYGQRVQGKAPTYTVHKILVYYAWCKKCSLMPTEAIHHRLHHSKLLSMDYIKNFIDDHTRPGKSTPRKG